MSKSTFPKLLTHVEEISFNEEKVLVLTQSTEVINQSKQLKEFKRDGGK